METVYPARNCLYGITRDLNRVIIKEWGENEGSTLSLTLTSVKCIFVTVPGELQCLNMNAASNPGP